MGKQYSMHWVAFQADVLVSCPTHTDLFFLFLWLIHNIPLYLESMYSSKTGYQIETAFTFRRLNQQQILMYVSLPCSPGCSDENHEHHHHHRQLHLVLYMKRIMTITAKCSEKKIHALVLLNGVMPIRNASTYIDSISDVRTSRLRYEYKFSRLRITCFTTAFLMHINGRITTV